MTEHRRSLNAQELEVLEVVLRDTRHHHQLPVHRATQADGPNQLRLSHWAIPGTLESIGEVRVLEAETEDCIRFRRPRLDNQTAEVTLELPQQVFHYRLRNVPSRGWQLCP